MCCRTWPVFINQNIILKIASEKLHHSFTDFHPFTIDMKMLYKPSLCRYPSRPPIWSLLWGPRRCGRNRPRGEMTGPCHGWWISVSASALRPSLSLGLWARLYWTSETSPTDLFIAMQCCLWATQRYTDNYNKYCNWTVDDRYSLFNLIQPAHLKSVSVLYYIITHQVVEKAICWSGIDGSEL